MVAKERLPGRRTNMRSDVEKMSTPMASNSSANARSMKKCIHALNTVVAVLSVIAC